MPKLTWAFFCFFRFLVVLSTLLEMTPLSHKLVVSNEREKSKLPDYTADKIILN